MTVFCEDSCHVSSCLHFNLIPCHHIFISCRVKSFQMGRLKGRCHKDRNNWAKAATMSRLRLQRESEVHHWRCRWERWYAEEGSSCEVRADTQDEEIDHSVWVKVTYTNIFFLSTGFRQHAQSSWQHFILSYQFLPKEVRQPKISKQRSRASSFIAFSRVKLLLCPPNGVGPGSNRTGLAFALHLVHLGAATWLVSGWLAFLTHPHTWTGSLLTFGIILLPYHQWRCWAATRPFFKDHAVQRQVVCLLWCHSQGSSIEEESTFII